MLILPSLLQNDLGREDLAQIRKDLNQEAPRIDLNLRAANRSGPYPAYAKKATPPCTLCSPPT